MRTDGADRGGDPWDDLLASKTPEAGSDVDDELEAALLTYKQQKAARWGAERFADELRRRDEAEEARPVWTGDALSPPVEASVEAQVVGGDPVPFRAEPPRIGFDPRFIVGPAELVADVVPERASEGTSVPGADADEASPEPDEAFGRPVADEAFEPPVPDEVVDAIDVDEQVDAIAEDEGAPEPVFEPEPALVVASVELPRFVPDAAWSAGSRAGKLERLPAALRNPHVPRPPAPEPRPTASSRRRWRSKELAPEPVPTPVITDAEWARMSPGARRLYGFEEPPSARRAG